jgi:hypothetical protein
MKIEMNLKTWSLLLVGLVANKQENSFVLLVR